MVGARREAAEVAELADASVSNTDVRKDVGVRLPLSAPRWQWGLPRVLYRRSQRDSIPQLDARLPRAVGLHASQKRGPPAGAALCVIQLSYGAMSVTKVPQLAKTVRGPPGMYSAANQNLPSEKTAAL